MSFKLLSVSSMYQGSLDLFYTKYPETKSLPYSEHLGLLLEDTTEFVGAYIRNFRKLAIEAECIIANDLNLQYKWGAERGLDTENKEKIIFDQVTSFLPDILLIENLSAVSSDLLKSIRRDVKNIRLIIANHCAPFNPKVLDSLKEVDFVITCTPGLKDAIEGMGKRSYLVYHGFDADLLKRLSPSAGGPKNEFIFSGSLISGGDFHSQRIKLIESLLAAHVNLDLYVNLEKRYRIMAKQSIYMLSAIIRKMKMQNLFADFRLFEYGRSWVDYYSDAIMKSKKPPVYGVDMFNLFQNSRIVLNFHIGIAGNYAGNMRMFEVTGVGSCLLTDNKQNMGDIFSSGNEVVVYDNSEDCIAKVKWLLDHEEERKSIALAGQQKTLKYHTVENRCNSIMEILENELSNMAKPK